MQLYIYKWTDLNNFNIETSSDCYLSFVNMSFEITEEEEVTPSCKRVRDTAWRMYGGNCQYQVLWNTSRIAISALSYRQRQICISLHPYHDLYPDCQAACEL